MVRRLLVSPELVARTITAVHRENEFMSGVAKPQLIPAADDKDRPTLRRGARGDLIAQIQHKLGIQPEDGIFGAATEARIREFQRDTNLVPDGIIGPKTWTALDDPS